MKFFSVFALAFLAFVINPSIAADPLLIPIDLDQKDSPNLRRDKQCPDGFQGNNCKQNVNECQAVPFPCTGGNKLGSYCVDYEPPMKFKCGCKAGYDAVLPNAKDVEDKIPVDWRPLKCLPQDVCVGVECHEDARCTVSSINEPVCVCIDDLIGDGVNNCAPPPKKRPTRKPTTQQRTFTCQSASDCNTIGNSVCREGVCKCKAGYFQINGKGNCFNENECRNGFPNDCHKNAICNDTEGSYTCTCKDGYQDLNSQAKPGTICTQINECLDPSMNNCNTETQVCLDRAPPLKWECVQRTPAPTPMPTPKPGCVNDKRTGIDTGCTVDKPVCNAAQGSKGTLCVVCIDDAENNVLGSDDSGCTGSLNVCHVGTCVYCVNDGEGSDIDSGCFTGDECTASAGSAGTSCDPTSEEE